MNKAILVSVSLLLLAGCSKNNLQTSSFKESFVQLGTHKLVTYISETGSKYLIVFESGLGDDHAVWQSQKVAEEASERMDVLLYDRAGYGKSTIDESIRDIKQLRTELEQVVSEYSEGRKIILIGHSLGGMIVRDYAISNPEKVAALIFVDASHELYNDPTQEQEDLIYDAFKSTYGANSGAAREAQELIEDSQYMKTLPNLPDVPVVAITSMKTDSDHDAADRQLWYDSKEALRTGVTDFQHITTTNSGHYIMLEEPDLIIENLDILLAKLPE